MMKPNIATFGNQPINLGHAIAADLTLAGYKVNVFDLPEYENALEPIRELGGIHVTGDPKVIASGKTGFAKLNLVTTDPEKALRDVDLLFIDIPAHQFESRLKPIIPYIKDGAVLHFNYYGYWPSLRVAPLLREAGKKNIKITECPSCLYFARGQGGHLDFHVMRKSIALSVFPGRKSQEVFDMMAKNILQTNFENLNMLWHPSIALLNIAYLDREKACGEKTVHFYKTGITESTGILSEAQDKEREKLCQAYGVPYTSLKKLIKQYSEATGKTIAEAQLNANFIKKSSPYDVDEWERWVSWDMPLSIVPMVLLADLAGVSMPIHRGLIDIFGALLGMDFWKTGLTLERLGLAGLTAKEVARYVTK
jgi:opine dehydrogenase